MADFQADARDFAAGEGLPIGRMVHIGGAALSLALSLGIGWWGYQTVMRDASGVPVIKAAEGVMREKPADPGGEPAAYQGYAVNSIAANGVAAPTADQVILAPRPLTLTDEDIAAAELPNAGPRLASAPATAAAAATAAATSAGETLSTQSLRAAAPETAPDAAPDAAQIDRPAQAPEKVQTASATGMTSIEALAAQLAAGATPFARPETRDVAPEDDERPDTAAALTDDTADDAAAEDVAATTEPAATEPAITEPATADAATDTALTAEAAPAPRTGLARSLRPRPRPAAIAASATATAAVIPARVDAAEAAAPIEAPAPLEPALDIAPETVPPGTVLAQIGALESEEVARNEWTRLAGRFEEYMGGRRRVIEKAASGGRSFYRLRAMGFADMADARRFCAAFVAEGTECIPVVSK